MNNASQYWAKLGLERGRALELCPLTLGQGPSQTGCWAPRGHERLPSHRTSVLYKRLCVSAFSGEESAWRTWTFEAICRRAHRLTLRLGPCPLRASRTVFLSPIPRPERGSAPPSCPSQGAGLLGAGDAERGRRRDVLRPALTLVGPREPDSERAGRLALAARA